jgi:hypothetical protein
MRMQARAQVQCSLVESIIILLTLMTKSCLHYSIPCIIFLSRPDKKSIAMAPAMGIAAEI